MSTTTLNTRIQLRRGAYSDYDQSFVPLKGEILLVDTASDGLRTKVGDGVNTFAQLSYTDEAVRNLITEVVLQGYYYSGAFYEDAEHTELYEPYNYKIYIDKPTLDVYCYDSGEAEYQKLVNIPSASSSTAGIMKLYTGTGTNTDGTISQKGISDELDKKFSVSVGVDEDIIFTNT